MSHLDSKIIKSVSVILPLFNESKRIAKSLPIIEEALENIEEKFNAKCELIFVDDGSFDSTVEVVKSILKFKNTKIISYPQNTGKGYAIKKGFEVANGDYVFFMDADLSTPVKYIEEFLEYAGNEIIIGTRKTRPDLVKVSQTLLRKSLGRGFTILTNFILGTSVTDFTCGFKMFPKSLGKKIFRNLTISKWSFDAEIVFLAKYYGYKIREIPVEWTNDADTKVKLSKDILGSLLDILKIKFRSITQAYDN